MKNSFYFDHDYNARNDQRILELRSEFGWAGYGIFFALIECLCESEGEIKRGALGGLSLGLSLPKGELLKLIDFMISIGLLHEENDVIFSKRVKDHLAFRTMLSEAGKRGGRGNKKPPFSQAKAPPKAGKERKEEESKENKRKVFIAPQISEVIEYFKTNGYSEIAANKFFNYYKEGNWIDGHGTKIRNWKQKAQAVWFKPENKIQSNYQVVPR